MPNQYESVGWALAQLALVHDAQYVQGISHLSELRVFPRDLVVWCSHVHHHSTFSSDFDVPQDVGDACDWVADPTRKRQEAFQVLIAFKGCLKKETDDRQYLAYSSA